MLFIEEFIGKNLGTVEEKSKKDEEKIFTWKVEQKMSEAYSRWYISMMRGPIDRFFVLNLFRITIPIRGAQKQRYSISHDGARQMEKKVNSKNPVSMSHLISDSELLLMLRNILHFTVAYGGDQFSRFLVT